MIVCNSTPLIYLAKLNKLDLLRKLFLEVTIPKAVYEEVVVIGNEKNYIDAKIVEKAVNEGWLSIRETGTLDLLKDIGIHKGELESISLAKNIKADILLDQTHARYAAEMAGLKPHGTLYVLLLSLSKKLITYDEYLELLEQSPEADEVHYVPYIATILASF